MTKQKIIAIDGPSGAGKSSLTKEVARQLGLLHIDSGAFYRTAAFVAHETFGSVDKVVMGKLIEKLNLGKFSYRPKPEILIEFNGQDLTNLIRQNFVSMMASKISALPEIRDWVNTKLREVVEHSSSICIMEGRDIGTVIFPRAILKIFLTATSQKRAERRFLELKQSGSLGNLAMDEILNEIELRDTADQTRKIAPLVCAEDALKIDTSELSFNEVLDKILTETKKSLRIGDGTC